MVFFKSSFSLFLGILSSPGAYAVYDFPGQVEAAFINIGLSLRQYLNQADITSVVMPPLSSPEELDRQAALARAATNEMENSMSLIRGIIREEDPRFSSVLQRLSDIFDANLRHAVSNLENRTEVASHGLMNLFLLERRMEVFEYRRNLLKRCAMLEFLGHLDEANPISNESNEALANLNMDIDTILDEPSFAIESDFVKGRNLSTSSVRTLFTVSYLWKVRRITQSPQPDVELVILLPSWTAFYNSHGRQRDLRPVVPPTRRQEANENGNFGSFIQRLNPTGFITSSVQTMSALYSQLQQCSQVEREALTCAICLDDIEEAGQSRQLSCGHSYHRICLNSWLLRKMNCPVCRSPVVC